MARRGRSAKNKGANYERKIAEKFKERYNVELKRTPQSGGFAKDVEKAEDFRGDIIPVEKDLDFKLHIECKNQKSWKLKEWLQQAEEDCPEGKIPVVVMHKHGTSKEYVVIELNNFFDIVDKDKIFRKVIN
ncbi:MAG: hypothetical protein H0Z24_05595 [Thermosipho sp. (in: Bacteria)]|nr:hypothetical protein [Thermosipho sp. (in: thermotogales)]